MSNFRLILQLEFARFQGAHTKGVNCCLREKRKSFGFSFFVCVLLEIVKTIGLLCDQSNPMVFVMSLWDWLLAAWIYEEIFDDDSNDRSCDDTRDYDSSYDYDDYEDDF